MLNKDPLHNAHFADSSCETHLEGSLLAPLRFTGALGSALPRLVNSASHPLSPLTGKEQQQPHGRINYPFIDSTD